MRYNLGNLLANERPNEAVDEYRAALRLHPGQSAYVHNNLGQALSRLGRLEEAVTEFRETVRSPHADIAEVRCNLAVALARLGRLEEAAGELDTATRKKPGMFAAWYTLGLIRLQQHKGTTASQALRRAARWSPPGPLRPARSKRPFARPF